jgi:hypothetical protein
MCIYEWRNKWANMAEMLDFATLRPDYLVQGKLEI